MSAGRIAISVRKLEAWPCSDCGVEFDLADVAPFTEVTCPECGTTLTIPAKLGHFLLLNIIGVGGMGAVYRALDPTLNREVAVKVLLKSVGDDQECIETIRREAQAAAQLSHPHVATVYQIGEAHGQPYIVMELVSGKHFDEMIDTGPLDQSLVVQTAIEIAEGLAAAARIGLIHNDIKPENILFDDEGSAKLVDFGLAAYTDQVTRGGIWGTPFYVSPEKVKGEMSDVRSDIYSFGATLYHALTGVPPFNASTPEAVAKARFMRAPKSIASLRADIHPDLAKIVTRMMQFERNQRYPTYASLLSDLAKVLQALPAPDRRAVKGTPVLHTRKATTTALVYAKQGGRTSSKIVFGKRPSSRIASVSSTRSMPTSTRTRTTTVAGKSHGVRRIFAVAATVGLALGVWGGGCAFRSHRTARAELALLRLEATSCLEEVTRLRQQVTSAAAVAAKRCQSAEQGLMSLRIMGVKDGRVKTISACLEDGKSVISESQRVIANCLINENSLSWSLGQTASQDALRKVLATSAGLETCLRECSEDLSAITTRLSVAHGLIVNPQGSEG